MTPTDTELAITRLAALLMMYEDDRSSLAHMIETAWTTGESLLLVKDLGRIIQMTKGDAEWGQAHWRPVHERLIEMRQWLFDQVLNHELAQDMGIESPF